MNIDVKQRVVGAIVLVALAVIILPLLLPGKGDFSVSMDETNIPEPPDYRFSPMAEAPEAPPMPEQPVVPLGVPAVEQDHGETPSEPNPAASEKAAAMEEAASPSSGTEARTETFPEARNLPRADDVAGWIVQLGSFSSQENALALRDKLRARGYATFVEPVKANGTTSYRVRVGPELSREAADKLREKLARDMKMQGLVQKYP